MTNTSLVRMSRSLVVRAWRRRSAPIGCVNYSTLERRTHGSSSAEGHNKFSSSSQFRGPSLIVVGDHAQRNLWVLATDLQECGISISGYQSLRMHGRYSTLASVVPQSEGTIPILLAQTGEGIADCELLSWFVVEGDEVEEFQPLCEVQSDKARVEITSRFKGKVFKLRHEPGAIVKVGEILLDLYGNDTPPSSIGASSLPESEPRNSPSTVSVEPEKVIRDILTTPFIRSLAKDYGVNLADVIGTGKDGRITKEDIAKYISAEEGLHEDTQAITEPVRPMNDISLESHTSDSDSESSSDVDSVSGISDQKDSVIHIRGFQRIMVKSMTAAAKIPHFHYTDDINVDALVKLKESLKCQGIKCTYLPFLLKALSLALQKYPIMNSTVNEDVTQILCKANHNIGVGMATSGGLVVPNIKNVQHLSVLEISKELERLTQLATTNRLTSEDLTGGTISVSNFGSIGGKYGSPILSVPEVAIVAIGKIQKLPRYDANGMIHQANLLGVTWGADHRVIDGATVANFCNEWKLLVEMPERFIVNLR